MKLKQMILLIAIVSIVPATGFSSNNTESEIFDQQIKELMGQVIVQIDQEIENFSKAPFDTNEALLQVKENFIKKIEILDYLISQFEDENLKIESQNKKDKLLIEAHSIKQVSTEWVDEIFILLTDDEMIEHMSHKDLGRAIVALDGLEHASLRYRSNNILGLNDAPLTRLVLALESYNDENKLKDAAAASKAAIQSVSDISQPIVDVVKMKEKHNQLINDCKNEDIIKESTVE